MRKKKKREEKNAVDFEHKNILFLGREIRLVLGWVVGAVGCLLASASIGGSHAASASVARGGLVLGAGAVTGALAGGTGTTRAPGPLDGVLG